MHFLKDNLYLIFHLCNWKLHRSYATAAPKYAFWTQHLWTETYGRTGNVTFLSVIKKRNALETECWASHRQPLAVVSWWTTYTTDCDVHIVSSLHTCFSKAAYQIMSCHTACKEYDSTVCWHLLQFQE